MKETLERWSVLGLSALLASIITVFFAACGLFANAENDGDTEGIEGIIALHQQMNENNGMTYGYYANVAVADGDYDKAYALYLKDCKEGSTVECLNAYYVGEERALSDYDGKDFANDLKVSVMQNLKACKKNESLGCANLFFAFEALDDDNEYLKNIIAPLLDGHNDELIADKALHLTKKECEEDNDATSCFFHARILRVIDHYADVEFFINKGLDLGYVIAPFVRLPMQSPQTISYFKRSCALDEALSCRYVAYWLDKYENDAARAQGFYQKACKLNLTSACDEARKVRSNAKVDEIGAPVFNRR